MIRPHPQPLRCRKEASPNPCLPWTVCPGRRGTAPPRSGFLRGPQLWVLLCAPASRVAGNGEHSGRACRCLKPLRRARSTPFTSPPVQPTWSRSSCEVCLPASAFKLHTKSKGRAKEPFPSAPRRTRASVGDARNAARRAPRALVGTCASQSPPLWANSASLRTPGRGCLSAFYL